MGCEQCRNIRLIGFFVQDDLVRAADVHPASSSVGLDDHTHAPTTVCTERRSQWAGDAIRLARCEQGAGPLHVGQQDNGITAYLHDGVEQRVLSPKSSEIDAELREKSTGHFIHGQAAAVHEH